MHEAQKNVGTTIYDDVAKRWRAHMRMLSHSNDVTR